jgi:type II secretion system protein J
MKKLLISRNKPRFGQKGFTMVEILLAVGIFGLVMIAIYSCWSAIMRGTRIGLAAAAEVQRTRVAVRALEESVSGAVMYADNPKYYAFMSDTAAEYAYVSFVSRLPDSFPGSGLFRGQPVRRVTFFVDDQKNLKMSQRTLLDMSEEPYTITLAPNVRVFAMEFWNPRMNEWIPEWISTNTLPVMMRVAVDFGPSGTGSDVTIRSIPLNAIAITRVGGNPQGGAPLNPGGGNPAVTPGGGGNPRGSGGGRGDANNPRNRGGNRMEAGGGAFQGGGGFPGGGPGVGFPRGGGGFGGFGGSGPGGGDGMLEWQLPLPGNFRANSGSGMRSPVFEGR